jgi:hypothetical protein
MRTSRIPGESTGIGYHACMVVPIRRATLTFVCVTCIPYRDIPSIYEQPRRYGCTPLLWKVEQKCSCLMMQQVDSKASGSTVVFSAALICTASQQHRIAYLATFPCRGLSFCVIQHNIYARQVGRSISEGNARGARLVLIGSVSNLPYPSPSASQTRRPPVFSSHDYNGEKEERPCSKTGSCKMLRALRRYGQICRGNRVCR